MLETDRTTTLDPPARLAVLLATTGLTQLDLARLLPVAGRTVRRWMEGVCKPPAVAFEQLEDSPTPSMRTRIIWSARWASKDRRPQLS
jgi:hypothetical protein